MKYIEIEKVILMVTTIELNKLFLIFLFCALHHTSNWWIWCAS